MKDIANHYSYRIEWSEEDGEYVGTVLEFPGLSWLDDSPAKALSGIQHVVSECVADMLKQGKEPPVPLTNRKYSGKFTIRVTPNAHRRLVEEAAEQGVSLNRLASEKLERPLALLM